MVVGAGLVLAGLRMVRGAGDDHGPLASPTVTVAPMPERTAMPVVVVSPPAPPTPTVAVEALVPPATATALEVGSVASTTPGGEEASATAAAPTATPFAPPTSPPSEPSVAAPPSVAPTAAPSIAPTAAAPTPPIPTALAATTIPSPAADAAAVRAVRVNAGDNLSAIAVRYYGSASPRVLAAIRAANPWLDDLNVIGTGQRLILPSDVPATAPASGTP
jgi:phage tail protein X